MVFVSSASSVLVSLSFPSRFLLLWQPYSLMSEIKAKAFTKLPFPSQLSDEFSGLWQGNVNFITIWLSVCIREHYNTVVIMMCGLSDTYVHSIMEFLRANSILRFDFVVISIRYVWFALFTFYVSPIYTIHEVSEWVSDWLCTRSNGQAIHSPVYNINWYIRLKWTRRALPSKRKLNFRRCTSFFPSSVFVISWFCAVCALSLLMLNLILVCAL